MDAPDVPFSHVAILHRASGIVASNRTLNEILGELVRLVAEITSSDACLVYLLDQKNDEIVLRASQLPHAAEVGTLRLRLGEGVTGWVAQQKSVVSLPSAASRDSRFLGVPALVEDTYQAFLSVPLVAGGETIGVINVHHKEPHAHSPEEIALVTFVGEQLGGAITRARLEEENARLQEEAQEMRRQLETRKLVERAKGILQQRLRLTEEEAYLRLRNDSRRQRRSMRELAEEIIRKDTEMRASGG